MATSSLKGTGNRLLDWLPAEELYSLRPRWEHISFEQAEEVYREDGPLSYVYFPVSGVYATFVRMDDGRAIEASTVGNEGMMGLAAALGLDFSPKTAITPVSGECLRLPVDVFQQAVSPGTSFNRIVRRYTAYSLRNAYQTVACNASHSAKERMCRWLLTNQDRIGNGQLKMTHESLAQLLGVRRQTVTLIAGVLQARRCIRSQRGGVRILSRRGLEEGCCECYQASRSLYERIMVSHAN